MRDERSYFTFGIPCPSRRDVMCFLVSALILSTATEALRVIGGNMTVVQGGTVILPCKLIETSEPLSQITWQRKTRGKPLTDNFCTIVPINGDAEVTLLNGKDERFKFIGDLSYSNGSLQFSAVTLMDEGTYTCIFTLFPSGNHQTEIPLNLKVPPVISLKDNHPTEGNESVSLATCTAAGSKPPAEVSWLTDALPGNVTATTSSTLHDNGTTTTVSSLFGVPTREMNGHLVQCVISSAALAKEEILTSTIQIHFPPGEVTIWERPKHSFECVVEANPNAIFSWSRVNQSLAQHAVRVQDAVLQFVSMTSEQNGLYCCTASNAYGSQRGHIYLYVAEGACRGCWIILGLLLSLIAVSSAAWYLHKSGKCVRIERLLLQTREETPRETQRQRQRQRVPTSYSSPEREEGHEEEPQETEGAL